MFAPDYRIVVDGIEITTKLKGLLMNLTLTENRGFFADELDFELDDSKGELAIPERGVTIEVWLKGAADLVYKGKFTVDECTHRGAPDVLSIRARSVDFTNGMQTNMERSWHNTSVHKVVYTIALELGLTPAISDVLANESVDHMDQTNESNASFLTRFAEQFDAIATVKDQRLLFIPRSAATTASGKPLPQITIDRKSGDQHTFSIADRNTYTGVKAMYNDLHANKKGEVLWNDEAEKSVIKTPAIAPYEPAKPTGQYKTLSPTYKTRAKALAAARKEWARISKSARLSANLIGVKANYKDQVLKVNGTVSYGKAEVDKRIKSAKALALKDDQKLHSVDTITATGDSVKTLRHVYASRENAKRAARATWRQIKRGMAQFSLTLAEGDPELMPELPVTVSGFKPQIDNTGWIITRATHNLSDQGYITNLEFEIKSTEIPTE